MKILTRFFALSLALASAGASAGPDLIFANGFEPAGQGGSFTIGGAINAPGLTPSACLFCSNPTFCLRLQLNGDATETTGDTAFIFDQMPLQTGESYEVVVTQEPMIGGAGCSNPQQSTCSVTNGTGTVGNQDITDIVVACQ